MNQPLAHLPELEELGAELHTNVSSVERAASGLAGLALIGAARECWRAGGWLQLLVGTALVARGLAGHCPVYYRLGLDTRH